MTTHHSVVDPASVITAVTPVTPLWVVVQGIAGLNDEGTAATNWMDWIFPVHAIGTVEHIAIGGSTQPSGAFLVADPATCTVAWLRRCNGHILPTTDLTEKTIVRVAVVSERPERGQLPYPRSWGKLEYDPSDFECDLFL